MVTIKDVAKRANVSFTTVSHVINKTRPVSSETVTRVNDAISALGYLPSEVARSLKSNRTRTIGMIVTTTSNPFFGEVIRGVERACFEAGYALMICNSDDVAEHLVSYSNTLFAKRVDAILVMTSNASPNFFEHLAKINRVPVVAIDAPPGATRSVVADNSNVGGRLAADFLSRRGFGKVACVAGPENHPRMIERLAGFMEGLEANGIEFCPKSLYRKPLTMEGGREAAHALFSPSSPERPEVIFALSDVLAIGLISGINELGLAIPRDVSIMGYDDIEFAAYTSPPLTTIRQDAGQLGKVAAEALLEHLDLSVDLPVISRIEPTLVVRKSVKDI
jgi:LacI family transcriptional regulator